MSDERLQQANRFTVALAAVAVIFVAALVTLLAWAEPDGSIGRLRDFAEFLSRHDGRDGKIILSLGALVVSLCMVSVIVIELSPPTSGTMAVRSVKAGDAAISTREVARRIDADVGGLPDIASCATHVARRGRRVEVVLDLTVEAQADLVAAADAACRRAHDLVERDLGLELAAKPRARLRYRELRLRSEAAAERPLTGWERPQGEE
jgi:hypothetical protein